jgi:hypothetical protein
MYRVFVCLLAASVLDAGVLVSRSDKGFQFTEAASVAVNGKDKALSLGSQPAASERGKYPSVHLGGTLLKDADTKVIALYSEGSPEYLLPEGLPKNAPNSPAAAWSGARLSYKKSSNDKNPADVSVSTFVAFLPEGVEELTHLCMNARALRFIGGKDRTFPTQLELLRATKAYSADPAVAPLQRFVEESMHQRYQAFESGTAGLDALNEALKIAELSSEMYPNDPEQEKLRRELNAKKSWLDRKTAVLHAFLAAHEWDPFLLGSRDVEKYQQALPEIQNAHTQALRASLEYHSKAGEKRLEEREFGPAYREFKLASSRQPGDKVLQQKVLMAWTDYSREVAIDHKGNRIQLTPGQREAMNQALRFAEGYKEENKLDSALKSVLEAENIDPDSLDVLLKKAEILGARREFSKALATLDEYDLRAVDEERERASKLKNDLLFKRTSSLEDVKAQTQKALSDAAFNRLRELSINGLSAKDDDPELLYDAGLASIVTRNPRDAKTFFTRYLDVSNTLDANPEQRARVRALLASVSEASKPEKGEANWLSGKRLPNAVYYCPISLAFQPRIDHITASNKMKVSFDWEGERLKSIVPTFEKSDRATGEKRIVFAYDEHFPQVAYVGYDDTVRSQASTDPDEFYKHSSLVVLNNPYIDPVAIQKLTGKNVTLGVSGNRFFNPFVWDGIHYFRLTYDEAGRVKQAREIANPAAPPGDTLLEFDWIGLQLAAVRGYQGSDEGHRSMIYQRTLEYQDGRLVAEQIQSEGKTSHIKYSYNGDRIASANCDKDPTLDDRSRQVTFR